MDVTAFRREAHHVVDWISDYLEHLRDLPVYPSLEPGQIRSQLPLAAPNAPEPFEKIFADFLKIIVPGMTHWQHPRFFAYFPANASPPSVLAEFLIAALGAQCMSWETSPAATELEQQMLEWMKDLLGIPQSWGGVIQPGVTIAGICSLHAARFAKQVAQPDERAPEARYTCYCSKEAHSSVEKLIAVAGIPLGQIRKIEVDANLALQPEVLRATIQADCDAGFVPLFAVATLGTTSTGAIDPISEMAEICREFSVWLHVDAAYFGSSLILPECAFLRAGIEAADSIALNPNKAMFVNFECTLHYARDPRLLKAALTSSAEYLKGDYDDAVTNYRDYSLALGRKFHALKLWFVVRSYGVAQIQAMLRSHIELAALFAECVSASECFEQVTERSLSIVCFRYIRAGASESELEELNRMLEQRVNASGTCYLSHTIVRGTFVLRFVPATTYVTRADVECAWKVLTDCAGSLLSQPPPVPVAERAPGEVG